MENLPNLTLRPDLLFVTLIAFMAVVIIAAIVASIFMPEAAAQRQFVRELLSNSVIQERMKDQPFDVVELISKLSQRPERQRNPNGIVGLFSKVIQDITWDVSGLIGMLVTVVLMIMIVTQKYDNIPREIFAGWAMILGYYFGKSARR